MSFELTSKANEADVNCAIMHKHTRKVKYYLLATK